MKIKLLHSTPLWVSDQAIGQCWGVGCFTGEKLKIRMTRVANKFKHSSTIEHTVYNFHISGISRGLLQELARHRIASYSVKSSRYTLKELKDEETFLTVRESENYKRASKYVVFTDHKDKLVNRYILEALENLRILIQRGVSNDVAKYCIPEAYKTELVWTINARSLQNFLELRSSKDAWKEIRNLANEIYKHIPETDKFLFEDSMYNPEKKTLTQQLKEARKQLEQLKQQVTQTKEGLK